MNRLQLPRNALLLVVFAGLVSMAGIGIVTQASGHQQSGAALSGDTSSLDGRLTNDAQNATKRSVATAWPMYRGNLANTGHIETRGPISDISVAWKFTTGDYVISSPAVVGDTVYVGSHDGNVYAVNAETGAKRWQFATGGIVWSSPAVVDGTVYVGSNGRTVGDDSDQEYGEGSIYAIDAETGTERWKFPTDGSVQSSPAVLNGTVFVGSDDGNVYALDADTGNLRWKFNTTDKAVSSSPAVVDGTVYVASHDFLRNGSLYALDAETGAKRWSFSASPMQWTPAVVNGAVYVSTERRLLALDAETGDPRWQYRSAYGSPAVHDGTVYAPGGDGLVALDATTGEKRWSFATDGGGNSVGSWPAVVDCTVYFGASVGPAQGIVYSVNTTAGSERWRFSMGQIQSSPAVVSGTVYVGSEDDNLYALTGTVETTPIPTPTRTPSVTQTTTAPPPQPAPPTSTGNPTTPSPSTSKDTSADGSLDKTPTVTQTQTSTATAPGFGVAIWLVAFVLLGGLRAVAHRD